MPRVQQIPQAPPSGLDECVPQATSMLQAGSSNFRHVPKDSQAFSSQAPPEGAADAAAAAAASDGEESSVAATEHSAAGTDVSTSASASASSEPEPDMDAAQQVVKSFVRQLVRGRRVTMLAVKGGFAECFVSLDRRLTTLAIARSSKKDAKRRGIPLEQITEICVGSDAAGDVELALDEFSVAIFLEDGSCLGFRFADFEERDTFALCLSMFVDGRKGQAKKMPHS